MLVAPRCTVKPGYNNKSYYNYFYFYDYYYDDNHHHHDNNNKVQTKTAAPLQHICFLGLYKGVETKTAAPSLFFNPPRKQPANKYSHQ